MGLFDMDVPILGQPKKQVGAPPADVLIATGIELGFIEVAGLPGLKFRFSLGPEKTYPPMVLVLDEEHMERVPELFKSAVEELLVTWRQIQAQAPTPEPGTAAVLGGESSGGDVE